MTPIDAATVRHMADLSRLNVSETEITNYTEQLAAILEYASHLPELPETPDEAATLRVAPDVAQPYPDPQSLLKNAVAVQDGAVKVPAILDRSEA